MILLVDDERYRARPWLRALETEFTEPVELVTRATDLLKWLDEDSGTVTAIVLDIMMPPPPGMTVQESEHGTRTGRELYRRARGVVPDSVPIYVLTNVRDSALVRQLDLAPTDRFYRKRETDPQTFAAALKAATLVEPTPAPPGE